MQITCVGGGPAGLYLAILMKQAEQDHEVRVLERNREHIGDGWGVVFWDDLLNDLRATDPETARRVAETAYRWHGQHLIARGELVEHEGGGYGIARSALLDILAQRASDLGVKIEFDHEVTSTDELRDADVVVAADGVNSVRRGTEAFGTNIAVGRNKYVWLGTDKIFDAFTFALEKTESGWIWFHTYAYDRNTSTCIIECAPDTWTGLGLDTRSGPDSLALLQEIFGRPLDGGSLISPAREDAPLPWLNFKSVTNDRWHADKTVLVGDAAHTTHFSIGSGTRLALQDAIALAAALQEADAPRSAFAEYEKRRRAALRPAQNDARLSAQWFEQVDRYIDLPGPALFALLRARRDPVLPHVPPKYYYRFYATAEKSQTFRKLKQQLGPEVRALYSRLKRR